MTVRPTPTLLALVALACCVPRAAHAQDDDAWVEPEARAAYDAIRARCPQVLAIEWCTTPNAFVGGSVHGDRATLVLDCSYQGNQSLADETATASVDLATCRASCGIEGYSHASPIGTFDVVALSEPPGAALDPPGTAFRAGDVALELVPLLFTADREVAPAERAGLSIRTVAPLPAQRGRPSATPATHLTAEALRALGVTPRPRPPRDPEAPRTIRAYRVTQAIGAPRETRAQAEHAVYEAPAARCIAVWHRAADTRQWVRCFPNPGAITWLGGDDRIVVGRFVSSEPEVDGDPVMAPTTFAIELATARFHALDVASPARCRRATRAELRDAMLTLRRCSASAAITLADLERTLAEIP